MAFDLKSWLTGFALGLAGKPFPLPQVKEPVAYLYNGVRLPKLPEWDKETYPYAYIYRIQGSSYYVYYSSQPFYLELTVSTDRLNYYHLTPKADGAYQQYRCAGSNPDYYWGELSEKEFSEGYSIGLPGLNTTDIVKWTNYDFRRYEDDTLILAASEPVPVYE